MQCPSAKSACRFKSVLMPLPPAQVPRLESKNIEAVSVEFQANFSPISWVFYGRRFYLEGTRVCHVSHAFHSFHLYLQHVPTFHLCLVNLVAWCHHGETSSMVAISQDLQFHVPFIPLEGGRLPSFAFFCLSGQAAGSGMKN